MSRRRGSATRRAMKSIRAGTLTTTPPMKLMPFAFAGKREPRHDAHGSLGKRKYVAAYPGASIDLTKQRRLRGKPGPLSAAAERAARWQKAATRDRVPWNTSQDLDAWIPQPRPHCRVASQKGDSLELLIGVVGGELGGRPGPLGPWSEEPPAPRISSSVNPHGSMPPPGGP